MKQNLSFFYIVFCVLFLSLSPLPQALGQIPQGFNYQAIARDPASGNPIANTSMQVRLSIQSDSLGGTIFWQEIHSVTTNSYGLIAVILGKGTRQTLSKSPTFSAIDWSVTPKYIQTEINYGGWKMMGRSKLWSVPYAQMANDLSGPVKKLAVTGQTSVNDEALFEVKNRLGQTVFAVYNEGVRAYVGDGAKGLKGGFAVGGFGTDKAGESSKYFIVSKDSVRIYLDTNPLTKPQKGGFAVGGYDLVNKAVPQEYLRVTSDSTRVYVKNTQKGLKGGFAVGGFAPGKGLNDNYMNMTPQNYFIGLGAGKSNTTGTYNSFMGYQNGYSNTTGTSNVFIGYQSGYSNTTGGGNVFLGNLSGNKIQQGTGNIFIGMGSGYLAETGSHNVFIGSLSGSKNKANSNIFIGNYSGVNNTSGTNNLFAGVFAGINNRKGSSNIYLGNTAGYADTTGNWNIFLGEGAGYSNMGSNNIIMGYQSGFYSSTGDNNIMFGAQSGVYNRAANNVFLGYYSGFTNSTGTSNIFLGPRAGYSNSNGSNNIYMGEDAGYYAASGANNVSIGTRSGYNVKGASNVFIGLEAGYNSTTANDNVFIGTQAGLANTSGYSNVMIGSVAGTRTSTGYANIFMGTSAGNKNTTGNSNVYIGFAAGSSNTTGTRNTFLGSQSGNLSTGTSNTFIGNGSGFGNTGNYNTFVGDYAGTTSSTGSYNTNLGYYSGYQNTGGSNTFLGAFSASSLTSGSGNVFIGSYAGSSLSTASNRLFIESAPFMDYTSSLIYGEFDNDYLRLNAAVDMSGRLHFPYGGAVLWVSNAEALWYNGTYFSWGFGSTYNYFAKPIIINDTRNPGSYMLYVAGNVAVTGTVTNPSDERLKTDITNLENVLPRLSSIRSVGFNWRKDEYPDRKFDSGHQLGFIAQEVEKMFPELVTTDNNGFKSMDYSRMTVVLLEAIKEQQQQIERLSRMVEEMDRKTQGTE